MRFLLLGSLIALAPVSAPAQDKGKKEVLPIAVVKLDRKDEVKYEKEIEPIFQKRCIACHSGPIKEGQLDLGSYDALIKGGRGGQAIVPGKGESSRLYKLAGRMSKPFMPHKDEIPLTPQELALIKLWIDQGAK